MIQNVLFTGSIDIKITLKLKKKLYQTVESLILLFGRRTGLGYAVRKNCCKAQ